jgi:hypothetical protein
MISAEAWEKQIKEIEEEDDYMLHVYRNKIFPYAIYNLTDNGLFNNFSLSKKLKALKSIIDHDRDIRKKSLFYDKEKISYIFNQGMVFIINLILIINVAM